MKKERKVSRSIYFPIPVLDMVEAEAERRNTTFSNVIVAAIEATLQTQTKE